MWYFKVGCLHNDSMYKKWRVEIKWTLNHSVKNMRTWVKSHLHDIFSNIVDLQNRFLIPPNKKAETKYLVSSYWFWKKESCFLRFKNCIPLPFIFHSDFTRQISISKLFIILNQTISITAWSLNAFIAAMDGFISLFLSSFLLQLSSGLMK